MAGLEPLASKTDLEARGLPTEPENLLKVQLESVSAAVREAAGVPISAVSTTLTLAGTREQFLQLPVGPVVTVDSVMIEDVPVTGWKLRDGRLWRAAGWAGQSEDVEVTLAYGFQKVPADIVQLVCSFVGAGMIAAQDGDLVRDRALAYTSIDDFREGYRTGDSEIVDVTELPDRVKNSLRARFSGGAHVTGGY